jgi:hypothetical protein
MVVNEGPLTLMRISGFVTNKLPLYAPLVTKTASNDEARGDATSMASWMFVAAVAQVE